MESKKISLERLSFNPIRKTIVLSDLPDDRIEIYNPSEKQKTELMTLLMEKYNRETNEIKISDAEVLKKIMPVLTNIYIDTENEDLMDKICENPPELFLKVVDEIREILVEITNRMVKTFDEINKYETEQLREIFASEVEEKVMNIAGKIGEA